MISKKKYYSELSQLYGEIKKTKDMFQEEMKILNNKVSSLEQDIKDHPKPVLELKVDSIQQETKKEKDELPLSTHINNLMSIASGNFDDLWDDKNNG